jgi:hypothetical protein
MLAHCNFIRTAALRGQFIRSHFGRARAGWRPGNEAGGLIALIAEWATSAALNQDARIYTRIGGEREPIVVHIIEGKVQQVDILFHLSTPVKEWWDNVIHARATFQPFHSQAEIEDWCARHELPRGAVVPLPRMWSFAADWYGDYLRNLGANAPWMRRKPCSRNTGLG